MFRTAILREIRAGQLAAEAIVRTETGETMRAGDLQRTDSLDWLWSVLSLIGCYLCASPLSLFALMAGRMEEGMLRDTKNGDVRAMVLFVAYAACASSFLLFCVAWYFGVRAHMRGRHAGFWVAAILLGVATVTAPLAFFKPMYFR